VFSADDLFVGLPIPPWLTLGEFAADDPDSLLKDRAISGEDDLGRFELQRLRLRAHRGDKEAIDRLFGILMAYRDSHRRQRSYRFVKDYRAKGARQQGGKVKAARLREAKQQGTAADSWMVPLFQEAYDRIVRHNPARIGRKRLLDTARQIAAAKDIPQERRDLLKLHQAQRFLDGLKSR
jgi:hypothetical protein